MKAFLILEDGTVFSGTSIGAEREVISEIVFNTSTTGYLEVLTDPSYAGQAVTMTYPLIGNYGICYKDMESLKAWPDGFIVRELSRMPSNFRCEDTIQKFLVDNNIPGIAGIDTSLYEAAKVDGASRWQQIRYITLPALVPLMVVLTILNVGKIFNSDFGLFYQVPLNTGALYPATNVISTYVYNMLMSAGTGSVGMASAAAFYQSIVGFILVMTTNFIVKKISPENALF